jgi:aspartyl-tRNA(Asn)/glutamyl-tRNA(Gln) amidotransferase subunit A
MADSALHYMAATELAELIRNRSLSPVELMEQTIARAQALNPQLNAICTPTFDAAMKQAREAENRLMGQDVLPPLHGIPTTIKDLALTRGVRTMAGSHVFAQRVPDVDHAHVERMRAAGMISIGKTTTSEFGWSGVSNSPLTGVTHNPWKHGIMPVRPVPERRCALPPGSGRCIRARTVPDQSVCQPHSVVYTASNRRTGVFPITRCHKMV